MVKKKDTVATVQQAPVAWEPIVINSALDDVSNYADQFNGRPSGRYTMTFETPHSSQSLSVYWDGEGSVIV